MTTLLYSGNVGRPGLGTCAEGHSPAQWPCLREGPHRRGGKGMSKFQTLASQLHLKNVEFRPRCLSTTFSSLLAGATSRHRQKPGTEGSFGTEQDLWHTRGRATLAVIGPAKCEIGAIWKTAVLEFVAYPRRCTRTGDSPGHRNTDPLAGSPGRHGPKCQRLL